MRKRRKKIAAALVLCVSLLSSPSLLAAAITTNSIAGWPQGPEIVDETGVLMEAETGTILYDKGMDQRMYPASTTKIMTALVVLENTEDLQTKITFTETGTKEVTPDSANIQAQLGEELTVEQCLYASLLASANEVSSQLAEFVGGTKEHFVEMMNLKAQELGCSDTHFTNPNGLPDENHYTTAHDLALIMQAAIQNETFREIESTQTYTIPATNKTATPRNLTNHHAMLVSGNPSYYEGAFAGKTGHTDAAKDTLVTAAEKNGMTLICVVLKSDNGQVVADTINLFNYGFEQFQRLPMTEKDETKSGGYAIVPKNITKDQVQVQENADGELIQQTYTWQNVQVGSAAVEKVTPTPTPQPEKKAPADTQEEPKPYLADSTLSLVIIGALCLLILIGLSAIVIKLKKKK